MCPYQRNDEEDEDEAYEDIAYEFIKNAEGKITVCEIELCLERHYLSVVPDIIGSPVFVLGVDADLVI